MDGDEVLRADLITPMAVRVAATLRLADHIAAGTDTPAAMAAATGADEDRLERLLAHLATVGIVEREGHAFRLTTRGERLRDDHPDRLRVRIDIEGGLGRADLAIVELLASIRGEGNAFERRYGTDVWSDLDADPYRRRTFDAAMSDDAAAWAELIADALDWGRFGDVIDVGGGDGTLLAALLSRQPRMRGRVLDLPGSSEAAAGVLGDRSLGGRGTFVVGSFFEPLPTGADAYLLSGILHDWPDERAVEILGRCGEAAGADGVVLVISRTGVGGEDPSTAMDLRLLVQGDGRERGATAISRLGERAGLRVEAVHPAGVLSVIELRSGGTRPPR